MKMNFLKPPNCKTQVGEISNDCTGEGLDYIGVASKVRRFGKSSLTPEERVVYKDYHSLN